MGVDQWEPIYMLIWMLSYACCCWRYKSRTKMFFSSFGTFRLASKTFKPTEVAAALDWQHPPAICRLRRMGAVRAPLQLGSFENCRQDSNNPMALLLKRFNL